MKRFLLFFGMVLFTIVSYSQRTITGVITDSDGEELIGASVLLKGSDSGTISDFDGSYSIEVPTEGGELVYSYTGYEDQTVQIGTSNEINVTLSEGVNLDEIIVTGVATGTSTKKVGFSIARIKTRDILEVPAADPGNALRGKVAGVRVVQASGNPNSAPAIRLRGSTNISGNQSPLYLLDGIILENGIRDIPVEDIASIEVIKGAAGSSLYGSLAGNGVIQYVTHSGKESNGLDIKLQTEFGFSDLTNEYPASTKHAFKLQANGEFDLDPTTGAVVLDDDGLKDNDYPVFHDNPKNILTAQPFQTYSFSMQNHGDNYNYYVSAQHSNVGGILENLPSFKRNSARMNFDVKANDKIKIGARFMLADRSGVQVDEQGQGANFFYSAIVAEPGVNLLEKDANGAFVAVPENYNIFGGNTQSPLYITDNATFGIKNLRIVGRLQADVELAKGLTLNLAQSIDNNEFNFVNTYPKGFITPSPNATLNNGFLLENRTTRRLLVSEASLSYKKKLNDFTVGATAKFLYEERDFRGFFAQGTDLRVDGVFNLANTTQSSRFVSSFSQPEVAENIFLNLDLDYQDKIILNGLIRRDRSSLFGPEEREKFYGRGSIAYILTEDVKIDKIDYLKLRLSYGTSGNRPPVWDAQHETFSLGAAGVTPNVLGNKALKPSTVSELEVGANAQLLNHKMNLEVTYSDQIVKDDHLLVPLLGPAGFSSQWQNVGEIKATAFEVSLAYDAIDKKDFKWNFNLNFDKITQEITSLNGVPSFTRDIVGTAVSIFRVEENLPYGAIYGNVIARSLSDLTTDENGMVINGGGGNSVSDYSINEQGNVVLTSAIGSAEEQALLVVDESGTPVVQNIGNTNPDFNFGFSNRFSYKGLSLYTLLDWQVGGNIYNYSKQLVYFNERHLDQDNFARQGKHINYSNGASTLYNQGNPVDYFVEEGTYMKLREVSLSYTLNKDRLSKIGIDDFVDMVRLRMTGRNLLTVTNYSGFDPEVAIGTNPTNFRLDEFSYPNFRSFSFSLEVVF